MSRPRTEAECTGISWQQPELCIREPGGTRRRVGLSGADAYLLGRSSQCQIRLTDARVSRRHLRLIVRDDGLWAVDLGSRAGTWRKGERLPAHVEVALHDGDALRVGRTRIRIEWYAQRLARFAEAAELPEQTEVAPPEASAPASRPPDPMPPTEDSADSSANRPRSDATPVEPQPMPKAVARPARRKAPWHGWILGLVGVLLLVIGVVVWCFSVS